LLFVTHIWCPPILSGHFMRQRHQREKAHGNERLQKNRKTGKYKKVCVTDPAACRRYGATRDRSGYSGKCKGNP
ncbi:hypothetical protein, partial [Sinorhizobium meliloti]|uniref:hypothetical protein n=1 Tax=Rhizobium meliloti TaxID=382 RepID=UPI001AEC9EC8